MLSFICRQSATQLSPETRGVIELWYTEFSSKTRTMLIVPVFPSNVRFWITAIYSCQRANFGAKSSTRSSRVYWTHDTCSEKPSENMRVPLTYHSISRNSFIRHVDGPKMSQKCWKKTEKLLNLSLLYEVIFESIKLNFVNSELCVQFFTAKPEISSFSITCYWKVQHVDRTKLLHKERGFIDLSNLSLEHGIVLYKTLQFFLGNSQLSIFL